jgi:hypothetical protein
MDFRSGLELSREFYDELVRPILAASLSDVSCSVALIGWGSEVQGFDTARSTDHAWGPRMQIFLGASDFAELGHTLDAALDDQLPEVFCGHQVRFAFPDGASPRHWAAVTDITQYFISYLGSDISEGVSTKTWLTAPTQTLRELTGGTVFHDGLGVLETWRARLAWYPDDIWRHVLASQWMRLDAEEPFVGRCGEVGDDLGSAVVAARQVRDLMKLAMLMARVYPPYSKWLGTAFSRIQLSDQLTPHLSAALRAASWRTRQQHLTAAYELLAIQHNKLGLTEPIDPTIRQFHTRPFLVLDSHRFANALVDTISDPALQALPLVGAIDQFVDNTNLLDRSAAKDRRTYINGPRITQL